MELSCESYPEVNFVKCEPVQHIPKGKRVQDVNNSPKVRESLHVYVCEILNRIEYSIGSRKNGEHEFTGGIKMPSPQHNTNACIRSERIDQVDVSTL